MRKEKGIAKNDIAVKQKYIEVSFSFSENEE
jgi:hypothetical protein